jgi:hypothetical protein
MGMQGYALRVGRGRPQGGGQMRMQELMYFVGEAKLLRDHQPWIQLKERVVGSQS